jgi:hypothetical protein
MGTAEITRAETSLITTLDQLADLTEKDRLVNTRSGVSPRVPVERIVSRTGRGKTVTFKYQDTGNPLPNWFDRVLQGFTDLVALPDNWDGEGATRIDREAINRALAAIDLLLPSYAPAPSVVPIHSSGLQIEWHRRGKDLEIEFHPGCHSQFYYFDETSGEEHEGPVGPNFAFLKEYLGRIW